MINRHIKVALLLLLTLSCKSVLGQLATAPDPILNSPNNTMHVHLYYLQSDSYDPAVSAKTIPPNIDSARAVDLAIKIKQVLDGMGLYVRLRKIPVDENFLDTISQEHFYTPFPGRLPELYLQKIDTAWYFSYETVDLMPGIHKSLYPLGSDFLVKILPKQANSEFLGLAVWQHLGLVIILIITLIFLFALYFVFRWIIRNIVKRSEKLAYIDIGDRKRLSGYFSGIVAVWVAKMMIPAVQLPVRASELTHNLFAVFTTILIMLLALALVTIFRHRAVAMAEKTETKMDDQLLPIVAQLGRILIFILALFNILSILNVNVTALIAGVSIGGLALALASKDTVQNLIGSAIIFIDKPFQIGDYIIFGTFEGTVTEVGFRSTRIMTVDTSIISIPNGMISNMSLTNLGMRDSRLHNIVIAITYSTPPDTIEAFISELRKMVREHERTKEEPSYIHLRELADSSINIMFRCYLETTSFPEELAIKEDILYRIIRIAERLNVDFAFPTQTVHVDSSGS